MNLPDNVTRDQVVDRIGVLERRLEGPAFNETQFEQNKKWAKEIAELKNWLSGFDVATKTYGPYEHHDDIDALSVYIKAYVDAVARERLMTPIESANKIGRASRECERRMRKISEKLYELDELKKETEG